MKRKTLTKLTACGLVGALTVGNFTIGVDAAPTAGILLYRQLIILYIFERKHLQRVKLLESYMQIMLEQSFLRRATGTRSNLDLLPDM